MHYRGKQEYGDDHLDLVDIIDQSNDHDIRQVDFEKGVQRYPDKPRYRIAFPCASNASENNQQ